MQNKIQKLLCCKKFKFYKTVKKFFLTILNIKLKTIAYIIKISKFNKSKFEKFLYKTTWLHRNFTNLLLQTSTYFQYRVIIYL